jgi:uncharacterized protein (TIGR00725 family)
MEKCITEMIAGNTRTVCDTLYTLLSQKNGFMAQPRFHLATAGSRQSTDHEQVLHTSNPEDAAERTADPRFEFQRPRISVFGSSQAKPTDSLYEEAYTLGRLLAEAGFDVATGGYSGVMEATSQGAREGGARVIGVTVAGFKDRANPFVIQEIRSKDIYERMRLLIEESDGYVALRGGMGTLCEVVFAWQMLKLALLPARRLALLPVRPLVLVGPCWQAVLDGWMKQLIVTEHHCDCFTFVENTAEAAAFLRKLFFKSDDSLAQLK